MGNVGCVMHNPRVKNSLDWESSNKKCYVLGKNVDDRMFLVHFFNAMLFEYNESLVAYVSGPIWSHS